MVSISTHGGDNIRVKHRIMDNQIKYARRCDITGKGMNAGYCIGEGAMYIKHELELAAHIQSGTDYKSVQDAYEDDYFYYTEWDAIDEDQHYTHDGVCIITQTL